MPLIHAHSGDRSRAASPGPVVLKRIAGSTVTALSRMPADESESGLAARGPRSRSRAPDPCRSAPSQAELVHPKVVRADCVADVSNSTARASCSPAARRSAPQLTSASSDRGSSFSSMQLPRRRVGGVLAGILEPCAVSARFSLAHFGQSLLASCFASQANPPRIRNGARTPAAISHSRAAPGTGASSNDGCSGRISRRVRFGIGPHGCETERDDRFQACTSSSSSALPPGRERPTCRRHGTGSNRSTGTPIPA